MGILSDDTVNVARVITLCYLKQLTDTVNLSLFVGQAIDHVHAIATTHDIIQWHI